MEKFEKFVRLAVKCMCEYTYNSEHKKKVKYSESGVDKLLAAIRENDDYPFLSENNPTDKVFGHRITWAKMIGWLNEDGTPSDVAIEHNILYVTEDEITGDDVIMITPIGDVLWNYELIYRANHIIEGETQRDKKTGDIMARIVTLDERVN
jgi:hypothetical protein